jgi:putative FmdB family regulatory protein
MYEFNCPKCERKQTELRRIEDRDRPTRCDKCGNEIERAIALTGPPKVQGGTPRFYR